MKKIGLIAMVILGLFGITGCQKYTTYTEISYQQLKEKMDAKDTFVLVVGSATCTACSNYKMTMEQVIKAKQVEIFYIDLNKLTSEEDAKLYSEFVVTSSPTTIFFDKGEQEPVINRIVGSADYDKIIEALEKRGYLGGK